MGIRLLTAALFLATSLSLTACGGGGSGGGPATGNVALVFMDGPTDQYQRMLVSVTAITLIGAGGQVDIYDGPPITFDLLEMSEWADLGFNTRVLAGRYNKIRLELDSVELIDMVNDESVLLDKLPANGKIDLNPQGPFEVSPDFTTVIKLDMDARRSFQVVETGNQELRLRPIIFVDVYQGDLLLPDRLLRVFGTVEAGSLEGTATPQTGDDTFRLCNLQFISQTGGPTVGDPGDCVRVFADGSPGVFADDGIQADFSAVSEGDLMTAVGFGVGSDDPDTFLGLNAVVLELGDRQPGDADGWGTVKGLVTSDPGACVTTPGDQCFDFDPDESDPAETVRMQAGTRVFRADGVELDQNAVNNGDIASIDALPVGGEHNAALVVLAAETGDGVIAGALRAVDPDTVPGFTVLEIETDPSIFSNVCVNPETRIVQVLADDTLTTIFDLLDPDVLEIGSLIEAFGDTAAPPAGCDMLGDLVVVEPSATP